MTTDSLISDALERVLRRRRIRASVGARERARLLRQHGIALGLTPEQVARRERELLAGRSR